MSKLVLILACIFVLMALNAFSKDLYLLDSRSIKNADILGSLVGNAHGKIDDNFIVIIDRDQLNKLKSINLNPELIKEDFDPEKTYLINNARPQHNKTALYFESFYRAGDSYLAELVPSDIDLLQREGYMVIKLSDFMTPVFETPNARCNSETRFDYPLDTLADYISQDSLYHFVTRLEAFQTRFTFSDSILAAREWIVSQFQSYGYDSIVTDTFFFNGYPCHNVLCLKPGTVEPDKLIVVGGHYDSINEDQPDLGMTFAPGADDNGSGTSVVLELARVLKDVETRKSILFCAFSAEELMMIGSEVIAWNLHDHPYYDVLVMFNFDNDGHTDDATDDIYVFNNTNQGYTTIVFDACERVASLIPVQNTSWQYSDHYYFGQYGMAAVGILEGDIDVYGLHSNIDVSSRMDFDYLAKVARMGVAAVGHVDIAPSFTPIYSVRDVGDGQSLQIEWGNCNPYFDFRILYGTEGYNYTDTVDVGSVPPCQYTLTGLSEGTQYYLTVMAVDPGGYPPIAVDQRVKTPFLIPRPPQGFAADPDSNAIYLTWMDNEELDFDHYELQRRPAGGLWTVLDENLIENSFVDYTAEEHVLYKYRLVAVDHDMNTSDYSNIAEATRATFDWQLLFVDETASGGSVNPSEEEQEYFYEEFLLDQYIYSGCEIDAYNNALSRSLAGQYHTIFWFDDDVSSHYFDKSLDSIDWFLEYSTNFFLAGWETIYWLTGESPLDSGHFVYDNFGILQLTRNNDFDFIGAFGQDGWPDLTVDTDNVFNGLLPYICVFEIASVFDAISEPQVIYTYNSSSDNGQFENQPCGVLYDDGSGINIALAFPIYHLTDGSAQALINKVCETFGIEVNTMFGDANGDELINLMDITFLINYLYKQGAPPSYPNNADANGDCTISILDITRLISYLYKDGPAPVEGCVN